MAMQSLGERFGHGADDLREHVDRGRASGVPPPGREHEKKTVAAGTGYRRVLVDSRARHPSAARSQESHAEFACPRCGSTSTTAGNASDAVRRLVALANHLLREDPQQDGQHPGGSPEQLAARLQRVARLRRELHVTANRVARFGVDERPILDPVRVSTPIASSAGLAPGRLLFQLGLAAGRLVALLDALSVDDWTRAGRMGDRLMTLGELVEPVLHTGSHDILDLLHASPRSSAGRKVNRDATAS